MEIKGTAVKGTYDFVKEKFPKGFDKWIDSLPFESKEIFTTPILAQNWYNITNSQVIPIKKIAELFYEGNLERAFFDAGKDGANRVLNGIYKVFIRIASAEFVVKKVTLISSTYYSEEGGIKVIDSSKNLIKLDIIGFDEGHEIYIESIRGWIHKLFDIINVHSYDILSEISVMSNKKLDAKLIINYN